MTFEEWWNTKDYPASCKGNCIEAFNAVEEKAKKEIEELLALIKAERKRQEECDDVHLRKISDLEAENAELKAYNEKLLNGDIEKHNKIVELEKENAELKKEANYKIDTLCLENAELKAKVDKWLRENTGLKIHNAYVEKKLTEAKELIEDMYDRIPASHSDYYKDVMERAEQFLKED